MSELAARIPNLTLLGLAALAFLAIARRLVFGRGPLPRPEGLGDDEHP